MKTLMNYMNLTKGDIIFMMGLFGMALILNVIPYPIIAATVAVIMVLLVRIADKYETRYTKNNDGTVNILAPENAIPNTQKTVKPIVEQEHIQTKVTVIAETRTTEEIISEKLKSGAIEKAIDAKFDEMIENVVNDLFGSYGDVTNKVKSELKQTMNKNIEAYDFTQYETKLNHLLSGLVNNVTKDQDTIIKNTAKFIGSPKIDDITTSSLYEEYAKYVVSNIDTSNLLIDSDDTPTYEDLDIIMVVNDTSNSDSHRIMKEIVLTCEQDTENELEVKVTICKWTDPVLSSNGWTIDKINKMGDDNSILYIHNRTDAQEITSLETPYMNLRNLSDIEVYFLKLYYDHTKINIDEEYMEEQFEVDDEPEYSLN